MLQVHGVVEEMCGERASGGLYCVQTFPMPTHIATTDLRLNESGTIEEQSSSWRVKEVVKGPKPVQVQNLLHLYIDIPNGCVKQWEI